MLMEVEKSAAGWRSNESKVPLSFARPSDDTSPKYA
jgi:hypothetical protein